MTILGPIMPSCATKFFALTICLALLAAPNASTAQERELKIGMIGPFSGTAAGAAQQVFDGLMLGVQHSGGKVGGLKTTVIREDDDKGNRLSRKNQGIRDLCSAKANPLIICIGLPVQEIQEVLRAGVPGGSGRVRAAAQTARRGVERTNALSQPFGDVRERRASRVVKVDGQRLRRQRLPQPAHDVGHLGWHRDADGVADGDLVTAQVRQAARHVEHLVGRDPPLVRAPEARRDVAPQPHSLAFRLGHEPAEAREALCDRGIDVLPIEGLAGSGKDRDLAAARVQCDDLVREIGREWHGLRKRSCARNLQTRQHCPSVCAVVSTVATGHGDTENRLVFAPREIYAG